VLGPQDEAATDFGSISKFGELISMFGGESKVIRILENP
jgi:hypothetical protein